MRTRGIAFKLSLGVALATALVFGCILAYSYSVARSMLLASVEQNAHYLAASSASRIENVLIGVQKVVDNMAVSLENSELTGDDLESLVRMVVEHNPEIYGSTIAFEPFAFDPEELYYAPYAFAGGRDLTYLGSEGYRYFYLDWYQMPRELGRPVWTEPYFDEGGGGVLMSTYAVPFFSRENFGRDFQGVVTADISLAWLDEVVRSVRILETGYAFVITGTGTIMAHPNQDLVMNESLFSQAESMGLPGLRRLGRRMLAGEQGFVPVVDPRSGEPAMLYYAPLPASGWSIGVVFPEKEIFADITTLRRNVVAMALAGLILCLAAVVFIARGITRPLRRLTRASGVMAEGNLEVELPALKQADEVGDLARSFDAMRASLREYITNLVETTAAKERIQSELMIARDIQLGILPKIFPAFPERPEFDVFASIEPAKEVGGDFYNFFFLDDRHFCFVIGDVSDKGVPAALFMAVTTTLFKAKAEVGQEPGELLALVNDDLAEENENAMFVTVFLGILDTHTGEVRYGSAGHNPPLVLRGDGTVEYMKPTGNPVLGGFEGMHFDSRSLTLAPGETLFTYTDGVTEAWDPDKVLYGEPRLAEVLERHAGKSLPELSGAVSTSIRVFARGEQQSDDITILALRYHGQS